jgi:hypothetical protein
MLINFSVMAAIGVKGTIELLRLLSVKESVLRRRLNVNEARTF